MSHTIGEHRFDAYKFYGLHICYGFCCYKFSFSLKPERLVFNFIKTLIWNMKVKWPHTLEPRISVVNISRKISKLALRSKLFVYLYHTKVWYHRTNQLFFASVLCLQTASLLVARLQSVRWSTGPFALLPSHPLNIFGTWPSVKREWGSM